MGVEQASGSRLPEIGGDPLPWCCCRFCLCPQPVHKKTANQPTDPLLRRQKPLLSRDPDAQYTYTLQLVHGVKPLYFGVEKATNVSNGCKLEIIFFGALPNRCPPSKKPWWSRNPKLSPRPPHEKKKGGKNRKEKQTENNSSSWYLRRY